NDWRMLDVETGKPVYLPAYNAEQFCMNNAEFRQAYGKYVRQLVAETGIDGLMSDDGIFYAGWRACACEHCRDRFQKEYGRRLPPVADTSFWGNRGSEAFADWIEMRFRTAGDYLAEIKTALPEGFPFLTCCSSSDGYTMPAVGMSYQDFIRSCNLVLLEMAGSTPSIKGTWDTRIPSQLLHLGIARDHRVPCLSLGYGFFPDTAFFVWALNKFLGSDSWFSTLKGRLNAGEAQLAALADDSELVEEGYRWEKEHPRLFTGDVDTDVAVFFSRATRDYYGQCAEDYVNDYYASCLELLRREIPYEVAAGGTVAARPDHVRACDMRAEHLPPEFVIAHAQPACGIGDGFFANCGGPVILPGVGDGTVAHRARVKHTPALFGGKRGGQQQAEGERVSHNILTGRR
ncbi:MAG TPA: hypothetical protein VFQ79_11745, partial [Bryobacteraceae bacterium]|nr:hypothetical protein [Bryobacteraceae bacterium]